MQGSELFKGVMGFNWVKVLAASGDRRPAGSAVIKKKAKGSRSNKLRVRLDIIRSTQLMEITEVW